MNKIMTRSLYFLATATFIFALSSLLQALILPNNDPGSPSSSLSESTNAAVDTSANRFDDENGTSSGTTSSADPLSADKNRQKSTPPKTKHHIEQKSDQDRPDLASPNLYPRRR